MARRTRNYSKIVAIVVTENVSKLRMFKRVFLMQTKNTAELSAICQKAKNNLLGHQLIPRRHFSKNHNYYLMWQGLNFKVCL